MSNNIDTRALQAFQELWAPVVAALPAVINAARQDAELQQSIVAKQAKFQELESAAAEKQAQYENRIRVMEERVAQAKVDQAAAIKAAAEEVSAAQAKVSAAKLEVANAAAEAAAATEAIAQQTRAAQAQHQQALADQAADFAARRVELEAEISALERKRATVQESIKALRAQLAP
jgi:predicted  nucleic acid-binding Zn-ribbon protein